MKTQCSSTLKLLIDVLAEMPLSKFPNLTAAHLAAALVMECRDPPPEPKVRKTRGPYRCKKAKS